MDHTYIENLIREERVAAGISIFIRLWLNGMTRSLIGRELTVAQLAMQFEITQSFQYRDHVHTVTSLVQDLQMPIPTVFRQIQELMTSGLVLQWRSRKDARKMCLIPSKKFFGYCEFNKIISSFCKQWYRDDTWSKLDKAKAAEWYFPMNHCSDGVAKKECGASRELRTAVVTGDCSAIETIVPLYGHYYRLLSK